MADSILTKQTSLSGEDVITRAVQYFATARWRPTTQSARAATFEGRPPIPWFLLLCMILSFMCFVLPGLIIWFVAVRKTRKFQNLVVTVAPGNGGTDVVVTYPSSAKKLASNFLDALPATV